MPTGLTIASAVALGLLVGSFLNVVIHRLPRMLEREWAQACDPAAESSDPSQAPYNLMHPPSACPACGHPIPWQQKLPVLSWLALRGRCRACSARISARYPLVELATGAAFGYCAWRWGITPAGAAWAAFSSVMLALAVIDWETTLLPDGLTLPLVWGGLAAAALGWTGTNLNDALWGAIAGYTSLWSIYIAFKQATGKEGIGFGDFKLFAALGAWLGWQALIPVILLASLTGAATGLALKAAGRLREGGYVPFGPFLALGGLAGLVDGLRPLLRVLGL